MAHIVVLGAGLGGIPMAYEMKEQAREEDQVTVISDSSTFHFVPLMKYRGWGRKVTPNRYAFKKLNSSEINPKSAPAGFRKRCPQ